MRDFRTRDTTGTVRSKRMGHLLSNRWALMADGLWRRGGQFEMVALALGRFVMSSTEIKDTGEETDTGWEWRG